MLIDFVLRKPANLHKPYYYSYQMIQPCEYECHCNLHLALKIANSGKVSISWGLHFEPANKLCCLVVMQNFGYRFLNSLSMFVRFVVVDYFGVLNGECAMFRSI